jgi:transcriptional regulator
MYVPSLFAEPRVEVLHDFIARNGFGVLVSVGGDAELTASHVPMLLDSSTGPHGTLAMHLARQNEQCRSLTEAAEAGREVLAIFQGPHAYVSPRWYQNPVNVPTWNYVVVHAYGSPRVMDDDRLAAHLRALVAKYEGASGWNVDSLPSEVVAKLQQQIVGFEIGITRLQGKWKLGQNRTSADRAGAIAGLHATGDAEAAVVAALMAMTLRP